MAGKGDDVTVPAATRHAILGGMGNLGRQLQKTLLEQGKYVLVIDRPPRRPNDGRKTEQWLSEMRRQYGISGNGDDCGAGDEEAGSIISYEPFMLGLDCPIELAKILHSANIETVYSLVTPDVQHGTVADFEATNVTGIRDLVDACRMAGIQKLIFASSMAVTNHFRDSINENENEPLPPMDSYETSYDRTKRLGEEIVLNASSSSSSSTLYPGVLPISTVALRLGAILIAHSDYALRQSFLDGNKTGIIKAIDSKPIDYIAGSDIAVAMSKVDEKLSTPSTASLIDGKVLYCTKPRDAELVTSRQISEYVASKMGWEVQLIPAQILSVVKFVFYLRHIAGTFFRSPETEPGMPRYKFLQIPDYQQTFDNSLIHKVLDWQPELTVWQALDRIIEDFKLEQAK